MWYMDLCVCPLTQCVTTVSLALFQFPQLTEQHRQCESVSEYNFKCLNCFETSAQNEHITIALPPGTQSVATISKAGLGKMPAQLTHRNSYRWTWPTPSSIIFKQ